MSNSPLDINELDAPAKQLLRELHDIELIFVNPKDTDRRNAAITLACFGLANLRSFERATWELSYVG